MMAMFRRGTATSFPAWIVTITLILFIKQVALAAPDHRGQVLFVSNRDGNAEIYILDIDLKIAHNLSRHEAWDSSPAWSPDGQKIAFSSQRTGNPEIFTMNADGSDLRQLTFDPARDVDPVWSPDGQQIAFVSDRVSDWNIYVMNADGGEVHSVEDIEAALRLENRFGNNQSPSWSPDGKKIAFASYRDGNWVLYIINVDGSNLQPLTDTRLRYLAPVWSPDGQQIAFVSDRLSPNFEIYLMDSSGGNWRQLTHNAVSDTIPSWTPDGQQIVFESSRDGNPEIYIMDANCASPEFCNVQRLTNHPASDRDPS
jgi:Tol biopolymer transport system component